MYLERLLQINMAVLATFGAMLLGMGQRTETPALLVAVAAATSIWITDIRQWFQIGRRTANVLMLLAALVSLREILVLGTELQTLGLAWFVIYLQIILLFQKKDQRTYWLLVILSLLQVVVATLFNQGVLFGVLLASYMFVGFSAMTLLLLYQQWDRYRPRPVELGAVGRSRPTARSRWPLALQAATLVALPGGSSHAGTGMPLLVRLGRMGLLALGITLVLFLALPRSSAVTWRGVAANQQPLVGFSDSVTLGELGQIIESREKVMRVRLLDSSHHDISTRPGEIYLQGAILMTYERGQWQTGMPVWDARVQMLSGAATLPNRDLVIQEITIEPLDRDELFYIAPFVALRSTEDIAFDYTRQRLLRAEQLCGREFGYRLGTTAIVGGVQKPLTPSGPKVSTRSARQLPGGDGATSLPHLVELARRWIAESKLPEDDRLGRARYLERKLAMSGQFQYSLVGQERNGDIDPIEDFVTEHPRGHCEYFATALTLMLRSQNIPARMIVGYKCDEWNAPGGYYQVRQLHAHTWVEAYLRPHQIPPALTHGDDYWHWREEGGWLRLDPTPAGAGPDKQSTLLGPLRRGLDWLDSGWSNYVVELDFQRQRDAIYQPITRALQTAWREVTDLARWRAMFTAALAVFHLEQLSSAAGWFAMAAVTILTAAIFVGTAWLLWWTIRRLRTHWTGSHTSRASARRSDVEFYRRFETLLSRQGLVRAAGQTQRQFAAVAAARLAGFDPHTDATSLPELIVDAFYRVRFGHEGLDNRQSQAVEHALDELSRKASQKRSKSR